MSGLIPSRFAISGHAVPRAGEHDKLELPVGQAARAVLGVPSPAPPQQREHRGQARATRARASDAGPARGREILLGGVPVGHDHVQLGEALGERGHPDGDLAKPRARVHDHDIGMAQLAQFEDGVGLGHLADHGDVRPDGQASGQSVTEQPARRLHGYLDGDSS